MPPSTRATILRSLRILTRAQRELQALLGPPGRRLPFGVRLQVRAFDVGLAKSLRALVAERQRTPAEVRRLEQVWKGWRKEASRMLSYSEAARIAAIRRIESPDANA